MTGPRYAIIRDAIRGRIAEGSLAPGDRVPSENELAAEYCVSRMTARRALRELAETGVVLRSQGLGSFVADSRPMSSVTQIRNIAEEIALRGHRHSCRVLALDSREATPAQAARLGLPAGATLYHSVIVHLEDDLALQHETRWVSPAMAPDYLRQDFTATTPSAYLSAVAPLTEAEQTVEAVLPAADVAQALAIAQGTPCLRINRRTFSERGVVSIASLVHPGDRYRLGEHINL